MKFVKSVFKQAASLGAVSTALVAVLLVTSCGSVAGLPRGAAYVENSQTSVVVLGVRPQMRIQAFSLTREAHGWHQGLWDAGRLNELPEGGYVVAEVAPTKSGEVYGIVRVFPSFLDMWHVCSDGMVATFRVPSRSVVYVGDITIVKEGRYRLEIDHDYAKAREFIRQNYPSMASRLIDGKLSMEKMESGEC